MLLFLPLLPLLLSLAQTARGEREDGNAAVTPGDNETLKRTCRHNPTWRSPADGAIGINRTACAAVFGWKPRSELWAGPQRNFFDGNYLSDEMEGKMHACVADALASFEDVDTDGDEEEEVKEPVARGIYPPQEEGDDALIVHLKNALNEAEARALRALSSCVAKHFKDRHEYRPFEHSYGGNEVTYLSAFLQMFVPGVAERVVTIASAAHGVAGWHFQDDDDWEKDSDWEDISDPRSLGIRTSEFLRYTGGESLGDHADTGSVYTVLIALSGPADYDGGEFFIETRARDDDDDDYTDVSVFKPDRLSALVFLSETSHGVNKVSKGTREMFATELWEYADAPFDMLRGSPEEWDDRYHRALAKLEDLENHLVGGDGWEDEDEKATNNEL